MSGPSVCVTHTHTLRCIRRFHTVYAVRSLNTRSDSPTGRQIVHHHHQTTNPAGTYKVSDCLTVCIADTAVNNSQNITKWIVSTVVSLYHIANRLANR